MRDVGMSSGGWCFQWALRESSSPVLEVVVLLCLRKLDLIAEPE